MTGATAAQTQKNRASTQDTVGQYVLLQRHQYGAFVFTLSAHGMMTTKIDEIRPLLCNELHSKTSLQLSILGFHFVEV